MAAILGRVRRSAAWVVVGISVAILAAGVVIDGFWDDGRKWFEDRSLISGLFVTLPVVAITALWIERAIERHQERRLTALRRSKLAPAVLRAVEDLAQPARTADDALSGLQLAKGPAEVTRLANELRKAREDFDAKSHKWRSVLLGYGAAAERVHERCEQLNRDLSDLVKLLPPDADPPSQTMSPMAMEMISPIAESIREHSEVFTFWTTGLAAGMARAEMDKHAALLDRTGPRGRRG